ncbi:MAG: hypothetical protein OEW64_00510 [Gammaproteobacteria bacterium]|nr:hypothetical protein [Gammaproteobacteria bacterium]MDH5302560.1 hypothetical protein [Gammaproteobacteria bacterium]MDH5321039.1 hypothetical protein [Gammaproteobacteria bacterium]
MKLNAWTLLFVILCLSTADAGGRTDKAACEAVKQKIREIEARMRNGYSAAQGIRYEARLRTLRDKRYELCRK